MPKRFSGPHRRAGGCLDLFSPRGLRSPPGCACAGPAAAAGTGAGPAANPEPSPPPADWSDGPLTPGDWHYRHEAAVRRPRSHRRIAPSSSSATKQPARSSSARFGAAPPPIVVRTTYSECCLPAPPDPARRRRPRRLRSSARPDRLQPRPLPDRGDGAPTLILPAWPNRPPIAGLPGLISQYALEALDQLHAHRPAGYRGAVLDRPPQPMPGAPGHAGGRARTARSAGSAPGARAAPRPRPRCGRCRSPSSATCTQRRVERALWMRTWYKSPSATGSSRLSRSQSPSARRTILLTAG